MHHKESKAIWLINKNSRTALGQLDYLPRRGERLLYSMTGSMYELEYEVDMVLYCQRENAICVFVELVQSEYSQILRSVNWDL